MPRYTFMPEQLPANSTVQVQAAAAPPPTIRCRPPPQHNFCPYPVPVPSNAEARSGSIRMIHEKQQYASQRHQQHTISPLHNAQQLASGSTPTRVGAAPQASPPFTTHVQQSSQTSPSLQTPPFQVYTVPNNLSPVQAQTLQAPRTPQTATTSSDQALRSHIVALLASTANGCISELGYAELPKENRRLKTECTKLVEKCNALQEENNALRRALAEKSDSNKSEQRDKEKVQLIQTLNERIVQLEIDAEVLKSQCRLLQQARSLDYPQEYKKLESKYHYALRFLQKHSTCLPNQQRQDTTRATVSPTSHADHAGTVIDLTISRGHTPVGAAVQQAATPAGAPPNPAPVPPQGMQTNTVLSPVSPNNSPPIISQRATSVPQISKHVRTTSVPSPVAPCSSAPPTVQVFPMPVVPSMTGPANVARPASALNNSRRVSTPSQIQQTQATAPTNTAVPSVAYDLRMQQHLDQFTAFAPSTQQATPSGCVPLPETQSANAVHSEEGRPQLQVQTALERPIQCTPPTPISAAELMKNNGSAIVSSPLRVSPVHVVHEITAPIESGMDSLQETGPQSQSQAQTAMRTETQRLSPSLGPGASAVSGAQNVERMEVDVEEKSGVQEVPVPQELKDDIQHGDGQGDGQDQDVVMSESEIQTHDENGNGSKIENENSDKNRNKDRSENGNQIEKENRTENKDANEKNDSEPTINVNIGVGIKQVPNTSTSNSDDPTGDNSVPARASIHSTQQAEEQQDERERREGRDAVQRNGDKGEGEGEEEEEEEGEEEENWADLTDDEDSNNMKQPVFDCISSIFYDDENDERLCNFCNARMESKNLPDPRPTFSDCSMRDLIVHAKNEHPFVWEKLRRPQGDS